jgi:hypothetical protein
METEFEDRKNKRDPSRYAGACALWKKTPPPLVIPSEVEESPTYSLSKKLEMSRLPSE